MQRKQHGKKSKKNQQVTTGPSWMEGSNPTNQLQSQRKGSVRKVQHNRSGTADDRAGASSRRQQRRNVRESQSSRTSRDRRTSSSTSRRNAGHQGTDCIEFTVTLQDLRNSLTDEQIALLLSGKYKPEEVVTICKNQPPETFDEDELIAQKKDKIESTKKIKRKRKVKSPIASLRYKYQYDKFLNGELEPSPETILGCYFITYKKLFGDEDPQWNSSNYDQALSIVKKFCRTVANNNATDVIRFIRKLLPLWKHRLIQHESFPDSRPTLSVLFTGKLYFWTNRKILYTRWKPRQEI
jgi:hypothetical protein